MGQLHFEFPKSKLEDGQAKPLSHLKGLSTHDAAGRTHRVLQMRPPEVKDFNVSKTKVSVAISFSVTLASRTFQVMYYKLINAEGGNISMMNGTQNVKITESDLKLFQAIIIRETKGDYDGRIISHDNLR